MKEDKMEEKIYSLQSVRAIAFLGVFLNHTDIYVFSGTGAMGVSIFIILSGFLMTYSYYKKNKIETISGWKNICFSLIKMKKYYLVHFICTLFMLVPLFVGDTIESFSKIIVLFILNLLLIQEWIPILGRSINGVSWYLCFMMLSYFIFPWIVINMEKNIA